MEKYYTQKYTENGEVFGELVEIDEKARNDALSRVIHSVDFVTNMLDTYGIRDDTPASQISEFFEDIVARDSQVWDFLSENSPSNECLIVADTVSDFVSEHHEGEAEDFAERSYN